MATTGDGLPATLPVLAFCPAGSWAVPETGAGAGVGADDPTRAEVVPDAISAEPSATAMTRARPTVRRRGADRSMTAAGVGVTGSYGATGGWVGAAGGWSGC